MTTNIVYKETHGTFSSAMKREIGQCSMCPFAGHDHTSTRMKACNLPFHMDYNLDPVRFGVRNEKGWDLYPATPPDWCLLRKGDLILKLHHSVYESKEVEQ